jgi:hypothetical protein
MSPLSNQRASVVVRLPVRHHDGDARTPSQAPRAAFAFQISI